MSIEVNDEQPVSLFKINYTTKQKTAPSLRIKDGMHTRKKLMRTSRILYSRPEPEVLQVVETPLDHNVKTTFRTPGSIESKERLMNMSTPKTAE